MKTLDTSILETRIKKYQQLRELLADPEIAEVCRQMVSKNGHSASEPAKTAKSTPSARAVTQRGQLFDAAKQVASGISGKFSTRDLLNKIKGNGIQLAAKREDVAIAGVLKRLVEHGFLRRSGTRGKTQYEVIR
jgi:hypothetical protein